MDISVSRLNNRMVLQVPAELPLGLVSIVGQVHNLLSRAGETTFELVEAGHVLHCRLHPRVAEEVYVKNGDMVRAGGHLAFDVQAARYCLLARDIEVVPGIAAARQQRAPILADIKKRAEAASLVRAELPLWVKQLAPPEVQAELEQMEEEQGQTARREGKPVPQQLSDGRAEGAADLSDNMLAFLSSALDRGEEVELTPEVLAQFIPLDVTAERQRTADSTKPTNPQAGRQVPGVNLVAHEPTLTDHLLLAAIVLLIFVLIIVVVLLILSFV